MAEIELCGPAGKGLFIAIDDKDLPTVASFRWYVLRVKGSKTLYARSGATAGNHLLHRLIMAAGKEDEVDHIDGDGLNNRRSNLRFVSHAENLRSATRLPGRYGNPTHDELDRELIEWMARTAAEQIR